MRSGYSRFICLLLTLFSTTLIYSASNAQTTDSSAIQATVEKFFTSIETRDRTLLESILVPNSLNISTNELANGDARFTTLSYEEMLTALTRPGRSAMERAWDETILIQGHIAVFWAPYDFHVDGEFTHCGVDSFQLIKQEGQWLITNASWTRETENCPASPLGPINQAAQTLPQ